MVAINLKGQAPKKDQAASRMWFAPERRVKTKAAAQRALEVLRCVESTPSSQEKLDEQELFQALHVCAYQATKRWLRRNGSADERAEWAKRWQTLRDFIVEQNIPLVYSMIGRFNTRDLDQDDVQSEAMFGLAQAVERFDPWRGFRFSTYACHAIHRAMIRSSRSTSNYRRMFPVQHDVTFERPTEPVNSNDLYVERLNRVVSGNLGQLTELESKILFKRFPTDRDRPRLTLQQVGRCVGLSKERVRQIQNQALSKLRSVLEADPVLQ